MTSRQRLLAAFAVGAVSGLVAGCQTYDFEPVQPLAIAQTTQSTRVVARNFKPNVMILLDKSGSMNFTICPGCSSTRIEEVRTAMNTFLSGSGTTARFGLLTYPSDDFCGSPSVGSISVPLPAPADPDVDSQLQQNASAVNMLIQSQAVNGGTPTGGALRALTGYQRLLSEEREDFVLLITDGLPNCNPDNPNDAENPATAAQCNCTLGDLSIMACQDAPSADPSRRNLSQLGCLDKDGSVAAVTELRARKIRTIVVGFGAETAALGEAVLNALAEAGGLARECPNGTDAECGSSNTCDVATRKCQKRFYQTGNAAELADALREIADKVTVTDPCEYKLESAPSDPSLLAVLFNDSPIARSATTWEYSTPAGVPTVRFTGDLCAQLSNATPTSAVNLEFRIIETL